MSGARTETDRSKQPMAVTPGHVRILRIVFSDHDQEGRGAQEGQAPGSDANRMRQSSPHAVARSMQRARGNHGGKAATAGLPERPLRTVSLMSIKRSRGRVVTWSRSGPQRDPSRPKATDVTKAP